MENFEGPENKRIPRNKFPNLEFYDTGNIIERKVLFFTDASGEKVEGLIGDVAYLRIN